MTTTFDKLGLSANIIQALKEIGYKSPFPIQQTAIPFLLKGLDVVGQAHTGTGKTAAFSLPILNKIKNKGTIQALILVPTRELAMQVTNEINKFAKYTGIKTLAIYGGQSINLQFDRLRRGVEILVATPGRLIDHIKRGSINLEQVRFVVLDEADRMLDMGFIKDIKFILFYVSEDRQTCLFSATMPPEILRLAEEYMRNYEEIRLNKEEISLETINQSYLIIKENEKFKHMCEFIEKRDNDQQTIIFVSTKQRTHRILHELKDSGYKAVTIHGDLSQRQRDDAIYRFRKGKENILVATDIVSRGIDVPAVGHIINYDIPEDPLVYFHRIGRTARAGATGTAISLVSAERVEDFTRILRKTELPIRRLNEELGIEVPISQKRRYNGYNSQYRSNYGNHRYDRREGFNRRSRYGSNRFYDSSNRYNQNSNFKRHTYNDDRQKSYDSHYTNKEHRHERHNNGVKREYSSSR
ncbi:MAG: DEAD/DEAH box helicase [Nitrososphaeraceae archaeon]|nr:DEAD/DEAH box helicase [Nitrososphaeraceae archaeon]